METWSLARVPTTWPEPYVTENCLATDWYVEEAPVLYELPVVQVPELPELFVFPPRDGFWVEPCCWQLLAVTQRSLEID